MKVDIQKAQDSDLHVIHKIETDSFADPWPLFLFEDMLGHPQQRLFVARSEKTICGYVSFWKMVEEVHILNICVEKLYRRKHVGNQLLQFVLNYYPAQEVGLYLLEVRKGNRTAQIFYESYGFEAQYVRTRYYPNGEDAIVMVLKRS